MIDLDTIKRENATRWAAKSTVSPAPWRVEITEYVDGGILLRERHIRGCYLDYNDSLIEPEGVWADADAYFIVFARNDNSEEVIDALVAEIERLRKGEHDPL